MMQETFYNIEAEQSVLGAVLIEPETVTEKIELSYKEFFLDKHRYISKAIESLLDANEPVDLVTIVTWLSEKKLIDSVGGVEYISKLAESVPTIENVEFYYEIVRKQAKKRKMQKTLQRMQERLLEAEDDEEIDSLMSEGLNILNDVGGSNSQGFTHIKEVMVDVLDDIGKERGDITGIPTGFDDLDRMTSGWQKGELVIVGARPSMGKTAFALNLTTKAAQNGALVPVYSLEMNNKSLGTRVLSSESQINSRNIKVGITALENEQWRRIVHEVGLISEIDILLNDKSGITVNEIKKDLIKLRKDNPERDILCFIDYLQLIKGDDKYKGNRTQELSDISRTLKTTALENDITIVALSQLSRGVEQRQDKRPMMSDIRESGSIEQDADVIMFLYRDEYYDRESENKNIVECIIAKQREGATGTVQLAFIKEYGRFLTLDSRYLG